MATLLALASTASAQPQTGPLTFSINGSSVTMPLDTAVVIDDVSTTLGALRYYPSGMQAQWSSAGAMIDGVAATPVFSFTLIGPVTDTSPLSILGQPLTITSDTTLVGFASPGAIALGTPIVVAGLVDANGSVLATLVERRTTVAARFLLAGLVQQPGVEAGSFRVGAQWVSAPAITFSDCVSATPVAGEFVELRANSVANFPPGTVLSTVTDGRCVNPVPAGTAGAIGFLEGLVTAVPAPDRFELGALVVTIGPSTVFQFGTFDDLDPGVGVIVHGTYVDAQTLAADSIEYLRPVVRFEAPMTPADVIAGISLSPFGIPVRWSAQVRDEDGILANGLTQPQQVEVRGYLDGSGQAYATRVRERGNANPGSTQVRGPVQAIAAPFITIQGLSVNTTGATFEDEYGAALTAEQFFAGVQIDHEVDANGAAYNAGTSTLNGGAIVWISAPLPPPVLQSLQGTTTITAGIVSGYSFVEPMFRDAFE